MDLLSKLIDGLFNQTNYPSFDIVIVNNQSQEPETFAYFDKISKHSSVQVVDYDFPFNYSAINNFGYQYCKGEILALLNNDLEIIDSNWLLEMVREAVQPDVGIVGAKLFFKNNFVQHAGVIVGAGQVSTHLHGLEYRTYRGYMNRLVLTHTMSAVTGACMVMRSEIFKNLKGFDEKNLAVAYNDVDLCLRTVEMGFRNIWTPYAQLYHLESASRPPDRRPAQIERYRREVEFMRRRWSHIMISDPFYNPNFSRDSANCRVAVRSS